MKLIRIIGIKSDKNGKNKRTYGEFLCEYDNKIIEKPLQAGLKAKSCGCQRYILSAESNKGKKRTIEFKQKISKIHKGKIISKEYRQKLSKANKGKKRTEEQKQRYSKVFKGKSKSEKHKINLSKSLKGKFIGENCGWSYGVHRFGLENPNWQGGKSFETYPQEFSKELKSQILERDNYTCQYPNCTEIHDRLHVHHIDFNKQNNNPENLITLGTSCHTRTNGKNRKYWTEFYQNIMINRVIDCLL